MRFWQSVTGTMEWDEYSPLNTAQRELAEETGIEILTSHIEDGGIHHYFSLPKSILSLYPPGTTCNREYLLSYRVDSPLDIKLCHSEHIDFRWVPSTEALQLVWSWSNRQGIRYALNNSTCTNNDSD